MTFLLLSDVCRKSMQIGMWESFCLCPSWICKTPSIIWFKLFIMVAKLPQSVYWKTKI